jgi:ectoine hydroxylase-related dioxygenase (phytanoyl-CoA dioxygenase family)
MAIQHRNATMDAPSKTKSRRDAVWLTTESGDFDSFKSQVTQQTRAADWPLADSIAQNVPVYSGAAVRAAAPNISDRKDLMAEWVDVMLHGPGIIVIKDAMPDHSVIDRATGVFDDIINEQRATGAGGGDHFAKPGANDRVWNALEKHCVADPAGFMDYYASDAIAMASEAWLGRGYQITAQVNRVNPGGTAQTPHRDYHLGFMPASQSAEYPSHVHGLSPLLTLQGAVAHVDMPLESGPTLYLPYSQLMHEGYLAFNRPEYQAYFAENHVQMPLEKGDALFFNPAVMHGAGSNISTDIYRLANLLQVGSGFGRSIEAVNRTRMVRSLYPTLLTAMQSGALTPTALANVVGATAEGYPFPTNLDTDLPVGGLTPQSQAEMLHDALKNGLDATEMDTVLDTRLDRIAGRT